MNRRFLLGIMLAVMGALSPTAASASTLIWDANLGTTDAQDGAGTWKNQDPTKNNWWDGTADVQWNNANLDIAQLGVSGTTTYHITVDGAVTAGGINVNKTNYYLDPHATNGGTITLNAPSGSDTAAINYLAGTARKDLYIYAGLAGSATYLDVNASSNPTGAYLFLYGTGTYTSTMRVTNTLAMMYVTGALSPASAGTIVNDGATLSMRAIGAVTYTTPLTLNGNGFGARGALNFYSSVIGVDYAGPITLGSDSTITVAPSQSGGSDTISGVISGDHQLTVTKQGSQYGELILTAANQFTGGTVINAATITLNSATGPALKGNVTFNTISGYNSTLQLLRGEENGGQAQLEPTAVLKFLGSASNRELLNLQGHTLTVGGINTDASVSVQDTCVLQNAAAGTAGTLIVDSAADYTYLGTIRDNGGTLAVVKRGTGIWTWQGPNTGQFTGGLTVENGTLLVFGTLPTAGRTTISGGTLDVSDVSLPVGPVRITGGILGGGTGYGTLTSTANYDIQGGTVHAILAGSVGLTKTGAGAATLTNANTYSGNTLINQGTLYLAQNPATFTNGSIAGSRNVEVAAGAILDVTGVSFAVAPLQTLQGFGAVNGNVADSTNGTDVSTLGAGNATTAGTLTLNHNLALTNNSNLSFDLSNNAGGTNDKIAVQGDLNLAGAVTNLVVHGLNTSLDTSASYTALTYQGNLTGSAANLHVVNPTRYTISYGLDTVGKKITVSVSGSTTPLSLTWVGDSSQNKWDANASPNWKAASSGEKFYEFDSVTFTDTGSTFPFVNLVGALHPAAVTVNNSETSPYTFSGTGLITGIGTGITKTGAGTLEIANTGGNNFTGNVSVTGGILKLGLGSVTPLGSTLGGTTISGSGALDLNDQELALGEVVTISGEGYQNNGTIINNGYYGSSLYHVKNLTLADNASIGGAIDWTVGGNPSGLLGNGFTLTKTGLNAITLNGLGETNLGDIAINGGTLRFSGDSTLGNTGKTVSLLNNAALSFAQVTVVSYAKNLSVDSSGGTIALESGGIATLTGNGALNGTLTVNVAASQTLVLGNNLSGPAGLDKTGSGILTLAGNNSYAAATTIHGGTLALDSSSGYAIPHDLIYGDVNSLTVKVNQGEENGGQPQMSPTSTVKFSSMNSGQLLNLQAHTLRVEGIDGVRDIASDSSYAIQNVTYGMQGTLIVDCNLNDHAYRGILRDGGGRLALDKRGSKTLTLMGASSGLYTGGLTVEAGTLDYFYGTVPAPNPGDPPISVPGALPAFTGVVQTGTCDYLITGGTLKIGKLSQTIGGFKITGGLVQADTTPDATYTDPGRLTSNANFDIQGGTVEASLAGTTATVGLNKTGPAAATLTGALLYTGNTTVSEGTLNATAINTPAATVAVLASATLNTPSIVANTLTLGAPAAANAAVPEPSTFVLLILGGLALIGLQIRRK